MSLDLCCLPWGKPDLCCATPDEVAASLSEHIAASPVIDDLAGRIAHRVAAGLLADLAPVIDLPCPVCRCTDKVCVACGHDPYRDGDDPFCPATSDAEHDLTCPYH